MGWSEPMIATKYTLQLKPKMDWVRQTVMLRLDGKAFATGSIREALHALSYTEGSGNPQHIVCKRLRENFRQGVADRHVTLWNDVQAQTVSSKWAEIYNSHDPPKMVRFLPCWMIKIQATNQLFACEPFMAGDYQKHNNNNGFVHPVLRNTPQAFSHFTWHYSKGKLMVVDIQGVDDVYTDPQIHTKDGQGYGAGNLGMTGVHKFFTTHQCNNVCLHLKLNHVKLAPDEQQGDTMWVNQG